MLQLGAVGSWLRHDAQALPIWESVLSRLKRLSQSAFHEQQRDREQQLNSQGPAEPSGAATTKPHHGIEYQGDHVGEPEERQTPHDGRAAAQYGSVTVRVECDIKREQRAHRGDADGCETDTAGQPGLQRLHAGAVLLEKGQSTHNRLLHKPERVRPWQRKSC